MKMKHLKHLLIASTVTALCACNNTCLLYTSDAADEL